MKKIKIRVNPKKEKIKKEINNYKALKTNTEKLNFIARKLGLI